MPEIDNEDDISSEEFSSTDSASERDGGVFDEDADVNSWDGFQWKVIGPYIRFINNQPKVDQAKRMKQLEVENARLKRVLADLTLDKQILEEVIEEL